MASHVEHEPAGTQVTGDSVSFDWRCERFEELGFSKNEARALANSKQIEYTGGKVDTKGHKSEKVEWTTPLNWIKVQTALKNGCTPELALEIFVT